MAGVVAPPVVNLFERARLHAAPQALYQGIASQCAAAASSFWKGTASAVPYERKIDARLLKNQESIPYGKGTSFTRAVNRCKTIRLQPLRFALADIADFSRSLFSRREIRKMRIQGLI